MYDEMVDFPQIHGPCQGKHDILMVYWWFWMAWEKSVGVKPILRQSRRTFCMVLDVFMTHWFQGNLEHSRTIPQPWASAQFGFDLVNCFRYLSVGLVVWPGTLRRGNRVLMPMILSASQVATFDVQKMRILRVRCSHSLWAGLRPQSTSICRKPRPQSKNSHICILIYIYIPLKTKLECGFGFAWSGPFGPPPRQTHSNWRNTCKYAETQLECGAKIGKKM